MEKREAKSILQNKLEKSYRNNQYQNAEKIDTETAMEIAVQTLEESERRENGCEYCNLPHKNIMADAIGEDKRGHTVTLFVDCDGQNIRAFTNDTYPIILTGKIRYCPMCGRKLGDGHDL